MNTINQNNTQEPLQLILNLQALSNHYSKQTQHDTFIFLNFLMPNLQNYYQQVDALLNDLELNQKASKQLNTIFEQEEIQLIQDNNTLQEEPIKLTQDNNTLIEETKQNCPQQQNQISSIFKNSKNYQQDSKHKISLFPSCEEWFQEDSDGFLFHSNPNNASDIEEDIDKLLDQSSLIDWPEKIRQSSSKKLCPITPIKQIIQSPWNQSASINYKRSSCQSNGSSFHRPHYYQKKLVSKFSIAEQLYHDMQEMTKLAGLDDQKEKRLFCDGKLIPKWAGNIDQIIFVVEDDKKVLNKYLEQKEKMNPQNIFGKFEISAVQDQNLFVQDRKRGSSANWSSQKNEKFQKEYQNMIENLSENQKIQSEKLKKQIQENSALSSAVINKSIIYILQKKQAINMFSVIKSNFKSMFKKENNQPLENKQKKNDLESSPRKKQVYSENS